MKLENLVRIRFAQRCDAGVPGYSVTNLGNFRQFYGAYTEIHQTASDELRATLPLEQLPSKDEMRRQMEEAARETAAGVGLLPQEEEL